MLEKLFPETLHLGFAQAVTAALLALAVAALARARGIRLERETVVGLIRGFVQVVAVGSVLVVLFRGPGWTAAAILAVMMLAGAAIAARRARGIPGALAISFWGIAAGSGSVIAVMTWAGVIDEAMPVLVPVGSMLIANGMNTTSLALERFRSDVVARRGYVEAALALGAAPAAAVAPHVSAAVGASLIPRLDTLRSLGIVWIPGVMAGMILSGSDPVYAAVYQFVVIAMIYASAGLTSLTATLLARRRVFTAAEQLRLPGEERR